MKRLLALAAGPRAHGAGGTAARSSLSVAALPATGIDATRHCGGGSVFTRSGGRSEDASAGDRRQGKPNVCCPSARLVASGRSAACDLPDSAPPRLPAGLLDIDSRTAHLQPAAHCLQVLRSRRRSGMPPPVLQAPARRRRRAADLDRTGGAARPATGASAASGPASLRPGPPRRGGCARSPTG